MYSGEDLRGREIENCSLWSFFIKTNKFLTTMWITGPGISNKKPHKFSGISIILSPGSCDTHFFVNARIIILINIAYIL